MKRFVLPLAVLLLAGVGSPARAQYQLGTRPTSPFARPTISPYINLFAGGNNAGLNYLALVRPQLETQAALQQLQGFPGAPGGDPNAAGGRAILDTGTPSRFLSYQQYFMTVGRPGSATGGASMFMQQQQVGIRR